MVAGGRRRRLFHSAADRRDGSLLHGGPGNHGAESGGIRSGSASAHGDKDWQATYQKIGSLVESGSREIFTLVE